MASIRHLVVILYRPCVSNFDSAYSILMQPRNFLKLIFFSFYFLLSDSHVYADNIKMPDNTNEIVINWISEHHKAKKNEIRLFMPSKKTFKTCHTGLELKKTKNKPIDPRIIAIDNKLEPRSRCRKFCINLQINRFNFKSYQECIQRKIIT